MDELRKRDDEIELPKALQVVQLYAVQSFLGSLVACVLLYIPLGEKIITRAFGTTVYAVIFGVFFIIGIVSGYAGGAKALKWLIKLIKVVKFGKYDE